MKQLVVRARVTEIKQKSEESAPEEVDIKDLVSKHAGQMHIEIS